MPTVHGVVGQDVEFTEAQLCDQHLPGSNTNRTHSVVGSHSTLHHAGGVYGQRNQQSLPICLPATVAHDVEFGHFAACVVHVYSVCVGWYGFACTGCFQSDGSFSIREHTTVVECDVFAKTSFAI